MNPHHADVADDFYSTIDTIGHLRYYSRITGKVVAKSSVPPHLWSRIKPVDPRLAAAQTWQNATIVMAHAQLRLQVAQQQLEVAKAALAYQLGSTREPDHVYAAIIAEDQKLNAAARKRRYERLKIPKPSFPTPPPKKYVPRPPRAPDLPNGPPPLEYVPPPNPDPPLPFKKRPAPSPDTSHPPPTTKRAKPLMDEAWLHGLGINTKLEWKQWLVANHPDKGGQDLDLCKRVIESGNRVWS